MRGDDFDGVSYVRALDRLRLCGQLARVYGAMLPGAWVSLEELTNRTGDESTASVSARLRDLRKRKFGGYTIERRRRGIYTRGLWEYRLVRPGQDMDLLATRGAGPDRAAAHQPSPSSLPAATTVT